MRGLLFAILSFTFTAHAQWTSGFYGANFCPYRVTVGQALISADDQLSNLRVRLWQTHHRMEWKRNRLGGVESRLSDAQRGIAEILRDGAESAIEKHFESQNDSTSYQASCASASFDEPEDGLPAAKEDLDEELTPIPREFCGRNQDGFVDHWSQFVRDDGRMDDSVCENFMPPRFGHPMIGDIEKCRRGLKDLYAMLSERKRISEEIGELKKTELALNRDVERLRDQAAEDNYCPHCENARLGYAPVSDTIHMPLTAPETFPHRPYLARMPGYFGMTGGVYGALPGGLASGAFGCAGTNPGVLGNPFVAADDNPFFSSGSTLSHNPYLRQSPSDANGLYNSGFGPSFNALNNWRSTPVIAWKPWVEPKLPRLAEPALRSPASFGVARPASKAFPYSLQNH